jgi:hypothetical protein
MLRRRTLAVLLELLEPLRKVADVDPGRANGSALPCCRCRDPITSTHLAQRPPLLSRSAYILPISPMPINPMVASSGAGSLAAVEEEEELMARWGGGDEMTALSVGGSVVGPRRR